MKMLHHHPFSVKAYLEHTAVITFAAPKEALIRLIPEPFELDIFDDKWGFLAVAMVRIKGLRPAVLPFFPGNDSYQIGYRIFVRYTNQAGRRLRGLYILRTETNSKKMALMGNLMTRYHYIHTDIRETMHPKIHRIASAKTGFQVTLLANQSEDPLSLPENSPFKDWKEARRFAGPMPFTFSAIPEKKQVLIVEGSRENWEPQPAMIPDVRIPFLQGLGLPHMLPAAAFEVRDVYYEWKKGRIETWH